MKSIQDLAREAGIADFCMQHQPHPGVVQQMEAFATLVIEQEHKRLLEGSGDDPEFSGLLTCDAIGLIGPPGAKWAGSPEYYPRVDLFTADQMAAAVLRAEQIGIGKGIERGWAQCRLDMQQ